MDLRQKELLKNIVEEYVHTALPVSSKVVAQKHDFDISPATIRNEMAALESDGYIYQPHTSAGRIPTLAGMEYYVKNLITLASLSQRGESRLRNIFERFGLRGIAKEGALYSHAACIVAHGTTDIYYTGFSQLFTQPEFSDRSVISSISRAIDHIESVLPDFSADDLTTEPKIYIGKRNPLGTECAAMFIGSRSEPKTMFGLVSPLRTNYRKNSAFLRSIAQFL